MSERGFAYISYSKGIGAEPVPTTVQYSLLSLLIRILWVGAQCAWLITAEKGATGKLVRKGLGMGKDACEILVYCLTGRMWG